VEVRHSYKTFYTCNKS